MWPYSSIRGGLGGTARHAEAFSPCNVTGFFRIHEGEINPLRVGSTGASVSIATGVTTRVRVTKAERSRITSRFNGQTLSEKSVSNYVSSLYCQLDGRPWTIDASHECSLPTGCGYGTSGAGAVSLSLALNEAFGLSLSKMEAAQLAHVSEIRCRTGLGTVASVFSGGLTLRVKPGAPGIGQVRKITLPKSLRLASVSFGPLSTSMILGTGSLRKRVNSCGACLTRRFHQHKAATSFMSVSRRFSDCLGLASRRLLGLLRSLDSTPFKSSMMMLGESMFCITPRDLIPGLLEVLQQKGLTPMVSSIATSGAHLI